MSLTTLLLAPSDRRRAADRWWGPAGPGARARTADRKNRAAHATARPSSIGPSCGAAPLRRHHHDVEIEPVTEQQQQADACQQARAALGARRKQRAERQHPVDDQVGQKHRQPRVAGAAQVVGRLLRDVAVPDEQVLADPDVRPEGGEGEQHDPQVVQLPVAHLVAQVPGPAQHHRRQRDGRDPLHERAGEDVDREHGAEPVRLERDDPVVGGGREGHGEHRREQRGQAVQPPVVDEAGAGIAVLGARGAGDAHGEGDPDQQHGDHAGADEAGREVGRLAGRGRSLGEPARLGPRIDRVMAGEQREQEDGSDRRGQHERLGDAAQPGRPARTAQPLGGEEEDGRDAQRQEVEPVDEEVEPHAGRVVAGSVQRGRGAHRGDRQRPADHPARDRDATPGAHGRPPGAAGRPCSALRT